MRRILFRNMIFALITGMLILSTGCDNPAANTAHVHDAGQWHITHAATFTAKGEQELRCTVCGEVLDTQEGDPQLVITNSDDLGPAISSATQAGTTADPIPLILALENVTNWNTTLFSVINNANKYVTLDLSACTMTTTAFTTGGGSNARMVTSIILPNTTVSISNRAFEYCSSLTSVTIPDGVTSIGGDAFFGSSLTSVTIPESVTSIGTGAFYYCIDLTNITVASANTVFRSEGNCLIYISSNMLIAGCKTSVIPDSVTSIRNYAFYYCTSLTSITIPNSVTIIGQNAFDSCTSLTSVTIGNSVTSIGYAAFYYCSSLTSVTFLRADTTIYNGSYYSFDNGASLRSAYAAGGVGTYTLSGTTWSKN